MVKNSPQFSLPWQLHSILFVLAFSFIPVSYLFQLEKILDGPRSMAEHFGGTLDASAIAEALHPWLLFASVLFCTQVYSWLVAFCRKQFLIG